MRRLSAQFRTDSISLGVDRSISLLTMSARSKLPITSLLLWPLACTRPAAHPAASSIIHGEDPGHLREMAMAAPQATAECPLGKQTSVPSHQCSPQGTRSQDPSLPATGSRRRIRIFRSSAIKPVTIAVRLMKIAADPRVFRRLVGADLISKIPTKN